MRLITLLGAAHTCSHLRWVGGALLLDHAVSGGAVTAWSDGGSPTSAVPEGFNGSPY